MSVTQLVEPAAQPAAATLSLFPDTSQRGRRLEEVVARVSERFGGKGITRAALLEDDDLPE